jgi:hypothetical protein
MEKASLMEDEDSEWLALDEDGDCTFCYDCLDLGGYKIYLCGNKCPNAIHFKCCQELDERLKLSCTLTRKKNNDWVCHYCRKIDGLKHADPIAAFRKMVTEFSASSSHKKKRKNPSTNSSSSSIPKKKQRNLV